MHYSNIDICLSKVENVLDFHDNLFDAFWSISSRYHAYFRTHRLFTNGGVDETVIYGKILVKLVEN